jgi:hypothetical protein
MKRPYLIIKKNLVFLALLAVVLSACGEKGDMNQPINIVTGPMVGYYYNYMEEKKLKGFSSRLENYPTTGSRSNLDCLANGQADFAITQADIISDITVRKEYNIAAVAPLFREYIYIFRLVDKPASNKLLELKPTEIRHINSPDKGSGTYFTAKRFREMAGIDLGIVDDMGVREALRKTVIKPENDIEKYEYYHFAVLSEKDPIVRDISDGRLDGYERIKDKEPEAVWKSENDRNAIRDYYESLGLIYDKGPEGPGYFVQLFTPYQGMIPGTSFRCGRF